MNIVVVGSVAYDSVQTPRGTRDDQLGGSATFFSLAAAKLGARSGIVAVVGEDFRSTDRTILTDHDVDLAGLSVIDGGKTFRWGGRYHDNMNDRDTLFTHLNVFENFRPQLPESYRKANLVFLGNIHPSLQSNVLEQVASPHFVAADTMNLWIDTTRDELVDVLNRVDCLFLNDEEAKMLTGQNTVTRAARAIQELGPNTVVVKRGEHGAMLVSEEDVFFAPAFPLEDVTDPTGAGDSFAGGFMGHLAQTADFTPANMRRAMIVGSLVASFSVEGFSVDRLSRVTGDDIQRRYNAFADLTRFAPLAL